MPHGNTEYCQPFENALSASSQARTGGTVAWTNPANATAGDGSYATSGPLSGTDKTFTLRTVLAQSVPALDAIKTLRVRVLRSKSPVDGWAIVDDLAQLRLSGMAVGPNMASTSFVPDVDEWQTYEWLNVAGLGITIPDIIAGNITFDLGYRPEPNTASPYNPANWTVTGGTKGIYANTAGGTQTVQDLTITATWTGGGAAPSSVPLSIVSTCDALFEGIGATYSFDTGLGQTESGNLVQHVTKTKTQTATVVVPVIAGVATYTLHSSSSATCLAGPDMTISITASASVVSPAASTVRVDSIQIQACSLPWVSVSSGVDIFGDMPAGGGGRPKPWSPEDDDEMEPKDETSKYSYREPQVTPKPPKGFESYESRKELAQYICRALDAHDSAMAARRDEWIRTQDVYDERLILSSMDYVDDVEPYNVALVPQRVDGVVGGVCSPITGMSPYFLFRGFGNDAQGLSEVIQDDVQYAFENAGFDRRLRDMALMAALRGRGFLRLRYETQTSEMIGLHTEVDSRTDGSISAEGFMIELETNPLGEVEHQDVAQEEISYSGLILEVFKPEDCVAYPMFAETITECSVVGIRKWFRRDDVLARQTEGMYFSDAVINIVQDNKGTENQVSADVEDYPFLVYDLIVRYRHPETKKEKRYRVAYHRTNIEVLALEEYIIPEVYYFAPAMKYEIGQFWPSRSIADRMLEAQTIYNDAYTLILICAAASALPNVAVSNYTGEAQAVKTGIGKFTLFKGTPNFFAIPAQGRADILRYVCESMERVADALSRLSQAGLGQEFRSGATATEVSSVVQGQTAGINEYVENMGIELERMANFARYLLAANFDAWKGFHGEAVKAVSPNNYRVRCTVEMNGKNQANSSQSQLQKVQALKQLLTELQVPSTQPTKVINTDALIELIANALDLNVSTSKVINDIQPQPQIGTGVPGLEQLFQEGGAVPPPEVLADVLRQTAGGLRESGMVGGDPGLDQPGA